MQARAAQANGTLWSCSSTCPVPLTLCLALCLSLLSPSCLLAPCPLLHSFSFSFLSGILMIASDYFSLSISVKTLATFSLSISWFPLLCPLILCPISHRLPFNQTPQKPVLVCLLFLTQSFSCQPGSSLNWQAGPRREQVSPFNKISQVNVVCFKVFLGNTTDPFTKIQLTVCPDVPSGLLFTENEFWSCDSWNYSSLKMHNVNKLPLDTHKHCINTKTNLQFLFVFTHKMNCYHWNDKYVYQVDITKRNLGKSVAVHCDFHVSLAIAQVRNVADWWGFGLNTQPPLQVVSCLFRIFFFSN